MQYMIMDASIVCLFVCLFCVCVCVCVSVFSWQVKKKKGTLKHPFWAKNGWNSTFFSNLLFSKLSVDANKMLSFRVDKKLYVDHVVPSTHFTCRVI